MCASGTIKGTFEYTSLCSSCGSSGGGGGGAMLVPGTIDAIAEVALGAVAYAVSYVYRQYTKHIKTSTPGMMPDNYPVTHHIIPYGTFSTRSEEVQNQLRQAQEIMMRAGVYPQSDPINQLSLSAAYHRSLHTDTYILSVTAPIIALGEKATKDEIYKVLLTQRFILAGTDPFAMGY
jgi:hypothetical protein